MKCVNCIWYVYCVVHYNDPYKLFLNNEYNDDRSEMEHFQRLHLATKKNLWEM